MASRSKSSIFLHVVEEEQRGVMVIYSVPVGYAGYEGIKLIDNARRPGRGSMMCPTINEESNCLRKKLLFCFGDRILSWAEGKGNGPFGSFAPPLKNP
jgi:hypothetical protein